MNNIIALLNLISLASSNTSYLFDDFVTHLNESEILYLEEKEINSWDSYFEKLYSETSLSNMLNSNGEKNTNPNDASYAFTNPKTHFESLYENYIWVKDINNSRLTSDASNAIPVNMQANNFYSTGEIQEAIINANVSSYTDYGGCGPIAAVGILDYFARYLDYSELIDDPTNRDERIELLT